MITQTYIDFFQELEDNNHKEWFHANKKTYEKEVKTPFSALIEELIGVLQSIDDEIPVTSKDIIMRINKDIRFSKDKTPYNTMMKANFTPGGRKSNNPGFYLAISAKDIHVGGGLYHAIPADLKKIRNYILANEKEILSVLTEKEITEKFNGIEGEKAKRLDKAYIDKSTSLPILFNKQFFYMKQQPIKSLVGENLVPFLKDHFIATSRLHHFLKSAINS